MTEHDLALPLTNWEARLIARIRHDATTIAALLAALEKAVSLLEELNATPDDTVGNLDLDVRYHAAVDGLKARGGEDG